MRTAALTAEGSSVQPNLFILESKKLLKPSSSVQKSGFLTGLGYDSTIDDYKLVTACLTTANGSNQIMAPEVFSLKTNSWRIIQGIHSGITLEGYAGVFWNGALHWLGKQETGADHDVDVIFSLERSSREVHGVCATSEPFLYSCFEHLRKLLVQLWQATS
ncbi:hypothetical protein OIU78_018466 [Salix suchowensis]|nr:hypothetical protein OIU78_018466 [Salix suchowensis]